MLIVGNHHLLADAKVLKDILQYHIMSHISHNIGNDKRYIHVCLVKGNPLKDVSQVHFVLYE